ncbi:ABC transporter permease [Aquabacterium sp.]|uniref:ABC transporter permease n=1 Tax=Aquabacterium sp. TaxID=1872578 RepID=UPI0035AD9001
MNITASTLSMAWRNLWRNRRRSLVTLGSLAFGFAAVSIFAGYTHASYTVLANSAIHAETVGHLTINRNGWVTEGKLHPSRYMLTASEIERVTRIVHDTLPGTHVIPRMTASGLLSNGRTSTIFVAVGIHPSDQLILRGPFRDAPGALDPTRPAGVSLSQGLADILGLRVGDSASVLSSTIHGQANAADVDITGTVNTGNVATNDKLAIMPLDLARELMDAKGRAEVLTLLLPSARAPSTKLDITQQLLLAYEQKSPGEDESNAMRNALDAKFKAAGLDMQVRTWQEMSMFYRQVKTLYDMIFALMLSVVLAIVVLSIFNAMSMAVVERTREIGTLRAIGLRRWGVIRLFVLEAVMLVVVGSLAGLALTGVVRWGVNAADFRYVPPASTLAVPLYIGFDAARTAIVALVLASLAIVAAFLPARRAARNLIIESLGHV